ncbi:MAG TPA: hypothetical protein VKH41_04535 [Myxococcota bacterium]|nr:hypothetical protein [Myxococcota bacterium]
MSATTRRATPGDLVGRDFARVRATGRLSTRRIASLVGVAFACALALAALRIDILRVRYALGEAIREEKALVQQQRQQTAALEGLRHPSRLVEFAQRSGFAPPERVIDLRKSSRSAEGRELGRAQQVSRSGPQASEGHPAGEAQRSAGPREGGEASEAHEGSMNLR